MACSLKVGKHSNSWKGGRVSSGHGYIRLYRPEHPRAVPKGYVYEHVVVAEAALGHYLPDKANVHHIDDDGTNNANTNLVVCQDLAYHKLLHQRQRAFLACGNPSALICHFCHTYERQDQIKRSIRRRSGKEFIRSVHPDCRSAYQRGRKSK